MTDKENKSLFDKLSAINVTDNLAFKESGSYTALTQAEKKDASIPKYNYNTTTKKYERSPTGTHKAVLFSYLSWATAWKIFKQHCPDAKFKIREFDGKPYLLDPELGYMVFTEITTGGQTEFMWLPVMDSSNNAKKNKDYIIKGKWDKTIQAADMRDINDSIMRCLVKNLAFGFGLGISIYAGEDMIDEPDSIPEAAKPQPEVVEPPKQEQVTLESDDINIKRELCTQGELENVANLILVHGDAIEKSFGKDFDMLTKAIKNKRLKVSTYEKIVDIVRGIAKNAT